MADKQTLVWKMVAPTAPIPGTIGEAYMARLEVERLVDKLEWETSLSGDIEGIGRIPGRFTTLAAPVFKWVRLNRLIRKWKGGSETVPAESTGWKKTVLPGGKLCARNSGAVLRY